MRTRLLPIVLLTLVAAVVMAIVAPHPVGAQPYPSSKVLVPYFEVDLEPEGRVTRIGLANDQDEPVEVVARVKTNWGIPVLRVDLVVPANGVLRIDLDDWLIRGELPGRTLPRWALRRLQTALSGQPAPTDGLYRGTEVVPDRMVGYVLFKATDLAVQALWGDYTISEPEVDFFQAETLVNLDKETEAFPCCVRTAIRFCECEEEGLSTELMVWNRTRLQPSEFPDPPESELVDLYLLFFNDAGDLIDYREMSMRPVEMLRIGDFDLEDDFGWVEIVVPDEAFVTAHVSGPATSSAAVHGYCIPEELGPRPAIVLEKLVQGEEADAAPGPWVAPGDELLWTFVVTNTGMADLFDVVIEESQDLVIDCPDTELEAARTMVCTATSTAEPCDHRNVATVRGFTVEGEQVSDFDVAHYTGSAEASVTIEKSTNGEDADLPPGPALDVGAPVTWTYEVTNTGEIELADVVVDDDVLGAVPCPKDGLLPGESMTCAREGVAASGQYENLGTVTATVLDDLACQGTVSDTDPSHYFGGSPPPAIEIVKLVQGDDANLPPGPFVLPGTELTWTFVVTNVGAVHLTDIVITESQELPVECPATELEPGESMTCVATSLAEPCGHENVASVEGTAPDGSVVADEDVAHYTGSGVWGLAIEKATNGHDADVAPGPTVQIGDPVTWSYEVTNTGEIVVTEVEVSDDRLGAVSCPTTALVPGESMTCAAHGVAVEGQYENLGSVVGTVFDDYQCEGTVEDSDPSHYFGGLPPPAIEIVKLVEGDDANTPPGPFVVPGSVLHWSFVVTNVGEVPLAGIVIVESQALPVECPGTELEPGESMTCVATSIAEPCGHENVASVEGTSPDGTVATDQDVAHYTGSGVWGLELEKATNGHDADMAPGPTLLVGDPVTWTYQVVNTGEVMVTEIALSDDRLGTVSCPTTALTPGESMTCAAFGVAVEGQYENLGSVVGTVFDDFECEGTVDDSDPSHYFGETEPPGDQGCSPGYWKNHSDSWPPTGYTTGQAVQSVFPAAAAYPAIGASSLMDALNFGGGGGVEGAARTLLRAGVASLLNAAHPNVGFPFTVAEVVASVDAALASADRQTMLDLAGTLDLSNNLGCPLS